MPRPLTLTHECPHCLESFDVEVYPIIRGRYHGRPEDCYPDEGGEVEPDECPACGAQWDTSAIYQHAEAAADDARTDHQIDMAEDRRLGLIGGEDLD